MARITVEDCLEKIDSQYDLVLLAKERTSQLTAGDKPLVSENNDKNTVISLREIGEGKISIKTLEDSAINKLRKSQSEPLELEDLDIDQEDNFDKIYKGEISKSGTAILPSKRVRKLPEKISSATIVEKESATIGEKESATIVEKESATIVEKESATIGEKESATIVEKESATIEKKESATIVEKETDENTK